MNDSRVCLRIYDLSDGHAAALSRLLIGRKFRGVWHCGIAVFGLEYFYGGYIGKLPPAAVESEIGLSPYKVEFLGSTTITRAEFERFLRDIDDNFTPETYHLIEWNCNHFADVCSRFLLNGKGIPGPILKQPRKLQNCWRGKLVLGLVQGIMGNPLVVDKELLLGSRHPNNEAHKELRSETKPWTKRMLDLYSQIIGLFTQPSESPTPALLPIPLPSISQSFTPASPGGYSLADPQRSASSPPVSVPLRKLNISQQSWILSGPPIAGSPLLALTTARSGSHRKLLTTNLQPSPSFDLDQSTTTSTASDSRRSISLRGYSVVNTPIPT
eukprot:Gregarina_sp_Poly_1__8485@NODE_4_length_26097_cov_247_784211_g3_i0_p9_GENE_NODE_4_length_26097_cov_247_784211_g3_i0NODE_4_length_26097_cov_247_784211_g3_i0_p9_ORF_typecomplete_len327_score36_66Peptidase_C97/PF05903_14/2_9e29LRAT/PF04970_13/0_11_NODE_4_length_26097_cov_247_784211_g3_i02165222632